ncbi:hypothetical protein ACIQF6_31255 [Kitasatospora sp. NPDC092948]|uniref:hypothetical protein n=1 Tax=Kitasatospora sp. NPDC092948 TaxID=3364088 RepID=UPI0038278653
MTARWVRRVSMLGLGVLLLAGVFTAMETVRSRAGWQVAHGAGRPGFFTVTQEEPRKCGGRNTMCGVAGSFVPDDTRQQLPTLQLADGDLGVRRAGEQAAGVDFRGTVYRPHDDRTWRTDAFLAWLGVMAMTAGLGLLVRRWRFGESAYLRRHSPGSARWC